ncbi:MAG: beta-lactamase family protein [Chloroflexi bacterium]|nr:beta-lactamase family protein [Chloroflexota bacterium]
MRKRSVGIVFLFVTITLLFALQLPVSAETDSSALDTYLEKYIRENNIPGLQVAVVENDHIVYARGFGIADASGRKVTPQTPFILGSTSKSFTALAVMQLVDAGRVNLDAPVVQYLPWFKLADEKISAAITVRHLLNHTSGIPRHASEDSLSVSDNSSDALERQVRSLSQFAPTHRPGTAYAYANANYQTVGLIVQVVSGESFESYVHRHIFAPLAMQNSFMSKVEAEKQGLAAGYRYWFGLPILADDMPYPRQHIPSGFYISTAEDVAHALIAHLNDGIYNGKSIVSPQGMVELHRPALSNYAMGWALRNGLLSHNGSVPEFGSQILIDPQRHLGVVVLFNVNNDMASEKLYALAPNIHRLMNGGESISPPPDSAFIINLFLLIGLLVVEVIWIITSVRQLRVWWGNASRRPSAVRSALFFGVSVIVEWILVAVLWSQVNVPFANAWLFQPDLMLLALILGFLLIAWSIGRTMLGVGWTTKK